MPLLSRWFVRSAILALLLGLLGATGVALRGSAGLPAWVATLDPVVIHLLTVGWLTQMIFGVAYWMFPRFSAATPRGSERLGWLAWIGLNGGLALRVIGEPLVATGARAGGFLVASAMLQLVAGLAFTANTWPRVKEHP